MFAGGADPCFSRKPKKGAKPPAAADAARWLARARTYLDWTLEYVAPRAAADFGALAIGQWCMLDGAHALLKRRVWQADTFAERAFLAEQFGDLEGARAALAVAQFIFALDDPTSLHLDDIYKDAFARLGTSPAPPRP
jgi:hypothetical protein